MNIYPSPLTLRFVSPPLELEHIVLNPAIEAWRKRLSELAEIDEESEEDEIKKCDNNRKRDDEG